MIKFFRKRMNKKGFTLVELLIVIAVLGIIAGIAVPSMSGVTDSFKRRADVETATIAIKQIEVYSMMGEWADRTTFAAVDEVTSTLYGEDLPQSQQTESDMIFKVVANGSNWDVTVTSTDGSNTVTIGETTTINGEID